MTNIRIFPYKVAPTLLIGQNHFELIVNRELREIARTSLVFSRNLLGWVLHGRSFEVSAAGLTFNINKIKKRQSICNNKRDQELDDLVKFNFSLDGIGINNFPRINDKDKRAYDILEKTSRRIENKWETGLLWLESTINIPDSRRIAYNRLLLLEKKLDRDAIYSELYYREMNRLFEAGYAVEAEKEFIRERVWYLPHFGVCNVNKPGKLRLVFDAAAKSSNINFNDLLMTGPDLLKSLPGVLMRFRQYEFAFKSDLRDMFLKIQIRLEDRDAQRFLWRGKERSIPPREYLMSSVSFGAKSSPCTAIYIKNRNASDFSQKYPTAANAIINNSYMDDFLCSTMSEQEARQVIKQVIEINKAAGWEMHGWACNSNNVLNHVNTADNSESNITESNVIKLDAIKDGKERVLGLQWETKPDEFGFQLGDRKISDELKLGLRRPTKREFLKIIISIYDPLGFLSPFLIGARIIMQKIWERVKLSGTKR